MNSIHPCWISRSETFPLSTSPLKDDLPLGHAVVVRPDEALPLEPHPGSELSTSRPSVPVPITHLGHTFHDPETKDPDELGCVTGPAHTA